MKPQWIIVIINDLYELHRIDSIASFYEDKETGYMQCTFHNSSETGKIHFNAFDLRDFLEGVGNGD